MPAFPGPGPLSPAPGPDEPALPPAVRLTDWPGLDPAPNVARIYDALLGGKDNYAADRQAARQLEAAVPGAARAARDNRAFLGRAVRFLAADAGITQFIDIGTGLPTRGHVHQIAHAADPAARVIYADNDPIVVAHARALLADAPQVIAVEADVRFPRHLLTLPAAAVRQARQIYLGAFTSGAARSRDDIGRLFDGLDLIPPGLTSVTAWRPRRRVTAARPVLFWAGIGRKPGGAS